MPTWPRTGRRQRRGRRLQTRRAGVGVGDHGRSRLGMIPHAVAHARRRVARRDLSGAAVRRQIGRPYRRDDRDRFEDLDRHPFAHTLRSSRQTYTDCPEMYVTTAMRVESRTVAVGTTGVGRERRTRSPGRPMSRRASEERSGCLIRISLAGDTRSSSGSHKRIHCGRYVVSRFESSYGSSDS